MKKKAAQFPKNYRKIPEYLKGNPRLLFLFFTSFLALLILAISIGILSVDLYNNYQTQKLLSKEHQLLLKEEQILNDQLKKFPNRDTYYNLAIVEYELGKIGEADKNIQKALEIDPNFENGISLKQKIEGN